MKTLKFIWFVLIANMVETFMAKMGLIRCVTATDIITEYGAYYENAGQNKNRILKHLTQDTETSMLATQMKTDDTIFKLSKGVITSLLQPFQKTFTTKGAVTFTPKEIRLRHMKVDFTETPDDIENSWLGFLASDDLTRKDWPLVRYLCEEYIIPKMREEFELESIFKGIYDEPTPGAAGAAADVIDGIQKLLQDGVGDGTINAITDLGALNESTIFDQVEAFVKQISQVYKRVPMNICLSNAWQEAYLRDKRAQGYYQIGSAGQIDNGIDFTPHKVIGLPSMADTDIIWATPKANLIHLTKKGLNANRFNIEESKREVFVMTDWWEGIGFGLNEAVWTNATASSSN